MHVYHIPLAATVSPASTNVPFGSNVTLNATAYGTPPLQFQWRLNGINIVGGSTNSFSITNIQGSNGGNYSLVISDFSGSVTSAVSALTVTGIPVPPTITAQTAKPRRQPGFKRHLQCQRHQQCAIELPMVLQ